MKNYLFALVALVLCCSCEEKEQKLPEKVLPLKEMTDLMVDVHLLEAVISSKNLPRDSGTKLYTLYKKDLLVKNKINDTIYKKSYDYYSSHPALMENLYEKIIDELTLREKSEK